MPWLWLAGYAAGAGVVTALPAAWAAAAAVALVLSLTIGRRHWRRRHHPPRRLEQVPGGWRLHRRGLAPVEARLVSAHPLGGGVIVLVLLPAGGRRYPLVVCRRDVGAAAFGRLRIAVGLA